MCSIQVHNCVTTVQTACVPEYYAHSLTMKCVTTYTSTWPILRISRNCFFNRYISHFLSPLHDLLLRNKIALSFLTFMMETCTLNSKFQYDSYFVTLKKETTLQLRVGKGYMKIILGLTIDKQRNREYYIMNNIFTHNSSI